MTINKEYLQKINPNKKNMMQNTLKAHIDF